MWTRYSDVDGALAWMDEVRRRMDRVFEGMDGDGQEPQEWPRITLRDVGNAFIVRAMVPGLSEKDVKVMLNQDVLTLSGERKAEVPPGYSVHRHERASQRFSRSFALPAKVDPEAVTATVINGVLDVTLQKARESQPRQINVRAAEA